MKSRRVEEKKSPTLTNWLLSFHFLTNKKRIKSKRKGECHNGASWHPFTHLF
ncbi:hypothetical protein LguiB_013204 [Lonicera macranthoides]